MSKLSNCLLIPFLGMLAMTSCDESSIFTASVKTIKAPEVSELSVEKIETDYLYSEFFAVYDTHLVTCLPNTTEYNFYVADIKNNKELGAFMQRGEGPDEYRGLTPLRRIEMKGNDVVALTFTPFTRELLEWNISQSLKSGKDSVLYFGTYENPSEYVHYSGLYKIGKDKYLGKTPGYLFEGEKQLPTYWILEGENYTPRQGFSIVKDLIPNEKSVIADNFFFGAAWSVKPDNTKIVDAMNWLNQINIIDIPDGDIHSYRVKGSPSEDIFETNMKNVIYQYHDVVCNDNSIFALYYGEPFKASKEGDGCYWLHEFDWNGNFVKRYRLPVPLFRLWMDTITNTLYGYCELDEGLYKLDV